jgi:hypothetical protein
MGNCSRKARAAGSPAPPLAAVFGIALSYGHIIAADEDLLRSQCTAAIATPESLCSEPRFTLRFGLL